jgi:hypothetical protein
LVIAFSIFNIDNVKAVVPMVIGKIYIIRFIFKNLGKRIFFKM